MVGIMLGLLFIVIGVMLMPIGFSELKEELQVVKETSRIKRIFVYLVTGIGFLSLDSVIGWILSLGLLFIFIGIAFILLAIF